MSRRRISESISKLESSKLEKVIQIMRFQIDRALTRILLKSTGAVTLLVNKFAKVVVVRVVEPVKRDISVIS